MIDSTLRVEQDDFLFCLVKETANLGILFEDSMLSIILPSLLTLFAPAAVRADDHAVTNAPVTEFVDYPSAAPAAAVINLPPEITRIKSKTLLQVNGVKYPDIRNLDGIRIYGFTLQKGEEITISMKVADEDSNEMRCRLVDPPHADRMTYILHRINGMIPVFRMKKITIKNITDAPYSIAYMVYGGLNRPYEITINRVHAK